MSDSEESQDSSDSEVTEILSRSTTFDNSSAEWSDKLVNITVTIEKDDITNQQVDVIVNSTSKSLDLKDGVASRVLVEKGGDSIQQECRQKYSDGISEGDIAVTGGGSLKCKQVYHVCLPPWDSGNNKMAAQKILLKCLEEASKSGHKSIAFPAIGTGKLNYDKDVVAKTMFAGVEKFSLSNQSSSVRDVKFVIFPSDNDTLQAFHAAGKETNNVDTTSRNVCSVKIKNIRVNINVGKLYEQQTDVVMTSTTRGLDLKRGTLSKSILEAAGSELQKECATKYPNGIQHGEIAVVGSGNIKCKNVYCGALPRFDKPEDGEDPKQQLTKLVTECLQQASIDSLSSISFPTLGTGFLMYTPKVAASLMLKAVSDFSVKNPISSLNTVNIVIQGCTSSIQKNLEAFQRECKSHKPRPPPVAAKPNFRGELDKLFSTKQTQKSALSVARAPIPIPRPRKAAVTSIKNSLETSLEQLPKRGTPEFCLHMYSSEIKTPEYWTEFTNDKTVKQWKIEQKGKPMYKLTSVDQSTFNCINQLVQNTWEPAKVGHGRDARGLSDLNFTSLKIRKIERIENLNLFEQYCHHRQQIFHRAGEGQVLETLADLPGVKNGCSNIEKNLDRIWKKRLYEEVNEGYFFHGTKKGRVQGLMKQGVDPRMAQGGAVFGPAVYMAESSTKADQYTDEREERQTTGLQMFLIRACLGKICLMNDVKKLRRPPCCEGCLDDSCDHDNRYDSVVGEGQYIFREFLVYDSHQVYPEYVISYDRVIQE